MKKIEISEIPVPGYHRVIEAYDRSAHLHCFIAVHDIRLGPALGGIRMYPYSSNEDALNDALRLSKSMTFKSACAQIGLGGGKSVIIADPSFQKTEALLLAFGEVLNDLKGQYIAAEDVGTSPEDLLIIKEKTPYVAALPTDRSSGDPSQFTAWGVFRGLQAVAYTLWGNNSLKGKKIALQGLGHVGSRLAYLLFWEGAELYFYDINDQLDHQQAHMYGAKIVTKEKIISQECDIFCPCAMGGVINEKTINQLHCKAIAGAANNQLANPELGQILMEKGILYAPDYIINSGGIINAANEFDKDGYDARVVRDKVDHIYDRLLTIFDLSKKEKKPTSQVADEMAEYNLNHLIGKRTTPIKF